MRLLTPVMSNAVYLICLHCILSMYHLPSSPSKLGYLDNFSQEGFGQNTANKLTYAEMEFTWIISIIILNDPRKQIRIFSINLLYS